MALETVPVATKLGAGFHRNMHGRLTEVCYAHPDGDNANDGLTWGTAKAGIQNAIDALPALGGQVMIAGKHTVASTINLPVTKPIRISGVVGTNNTDLGSWVTGNVAGPIFSRANSSELSGPIIEDLTIVNTNAAGTAIYIDGDFVPAGVYRCYIRAFKGIILDATDNSNFTIADNRLVWTATAGSIGIYSLGQTLMTNNDIVGYDHGVRIIGAGHALMKSRIEVCVTGIMMGQNLAGGSVAASCAIAGVEMEACDTFIRLNNVSGATVTNLHMLGSGNAPSGGSIRGFYADGGAKYLTISGCTATGTFSTAFIDISGAANKCITVIDTSSAQPWLLGTGVDVSLLDCEINGVRKTRLSGPFAVPSKIEVSLTAGQNNWNPTGLDSASAIRMDNNGAYTITGLQGGEEGRILHLMNISGTNAITLAHESGSSTAANRFACPGAVNFAIPTAGGVDLFYDNNAGIPRWRVMSK